MKFTAILLLAAALQLSAKGDAQGITLSEKNAPLEKIFASIKKQTGYSFLYTREMLQNTRNVNIEVSNADIKKVLDECLKGQPLTYSILNNTIIIKPRETKSPNDVIASEAKQPLPPVDISGRITDADGNGLQGASVRVKGTETGTSTDANGFFKLTGIAEDAVLEISYVGFEKKSLSAASFKVINNTLALKRNDSPLDDVQIIAYGTTSKRLSTGNVATVKAADIEKQPVSNPLLALAGRVPGLVITQANGFPGSGVTVRIQGVNSIAGGNDPLYVIDGVPYSAQLLPTISNTFGSSGGTLVNSGGINYGTYGSPLSYINPADIESIEVLKDADATAIYGSRAANGAILITTKKGKAGEQKIEFNIQQGWGKVTRKMDLLDRRQYLDMRYEALKNDGIPLSSLDKNSNFDLTVWDTTRSTDWQKVLIGNTSHYTDIQTSVSGGNTNTYFSIGGGYHRETTVLPGDFNDQKASLHFQISSSSNNQKFRIRLMGNFLSDVNQLPSVFTTDLTEMAMRLPPVAPALYNSDRSINWALNPSGISTWAYPGNPVAQLLNKYKNKTNNLVSNLDLSYKITEGLFIKSSFGYTNLQTTETVTVPLSSTAPELRANTTRLGIYGNSNINSWIIEPQISYERNIAKGKLEVLIGSTIQQNKSEGQSIYGFGYTTDEAISNISAASRTQAELEIENTYKYNAAFARVNYTWERKYILNLNARRDGSSRFGANSQFHNFGSAGAAWIFSEEKFLQKRFPVISFGKLKASYGTTGNDQIGDYRFLSLYNAVTAGVPYQGITTLQNNNLPNSYLQWEETRKLYIGLDLGFLKDKIIVNAGYYRNRSSNQLLSYKLPATTGFNAILENFPALVQNTGWEFSINSSNLKSKNFEWTTTVNLTMPRNKLVEFPGIGGSTYANILVVGEPITLVKRLHLIGVDPATGGYYFFSKTDPNNPKLPEDATVLINTSPAFYGGIQNSISYKGFELDFLFQFVKQKGPDYFFGRFPGSSRLNQPEYVLDRWQNPGDNAPHQRFNSDFSLSNQWSNAAGFSDASYADASFARLKNISLSWQLPDALLKRVKLHAVRLYAHAQNLLTITNYKGLDPETLSSSSLPPLRVVTVGMKVEL